MNKRELEAVLRSADPKQLEQLKRMVAGADASDLQKQLGRVDSKMLDKALRQLNITDESQKRTVEQLLAQVKRNPAMIEQLKRKL